MEQVFSLLNFLYVVGSIVPYSIYFAYLIGVCLPYSIYIVTVLLADTMIIGPLVTHLLMQRQRDGRNRLAPGLWIMVAVFVFLGLACFAVHRVGYASHSHWIWPTRYFAFATLNILFIGPLLVEACGRDPDKCSFLGRWLVRRPWVIALIFLSFTWIGMRVKGFRNILQDVAQSFASNHPGTLEFFMYQLVYWVAVVFVTKIQFKGNPIGKIVAWVMEVLDSPFIDRDDPVQSKAVLAERMPRLKAQNVSTIWFIGGTRSDHVLPAKWGSFVESIRYGIPITPVAFKHWFELPLWPFNQLYRLEALGFIARLPDRVTKSGKTKPHLLKVILRATQKLKLFNPFAFPVVMIGEPIRTEGLTPKDTEALLIRTQHAIIDMHLAIGGKGGDKSMPFAPSVREKNGNGKVAAPPATLAI